MDGYTRQQLRAVITEATHQLRTYHGVSTTVAYQYSGTSVTTAEIDERFSVFDHVVTPIELSQ